MTCALQCCNMHRVSLLLCAFKFKHPCCHRHGCRCCFGVLAFWFLVLFSVCCYFLQWSMLVYCFAGVLSREREFKLKRSLKLDWQSLMQTFCCVQQYLFPSSDLINILEKVKAMNNVQLCIPAKNLTMHSYCAFSQIIILIGLSKSYNDVTGDIT